ncbi:cation efflux family protein [Dissulfurispira thermophila]|uniref:Cation efflux family protein n=1 Tax=Dissulfurispira thermophila TaxID=2715679 RepID=A0A7G1H4D6_9BACT|nr:cation diffusion facilitator family transporter [Dissulfurispira thermophila]BCB97059.1 cation efflux family protein [Dissulfurispira thermophila]
MKQVSIKKLSWALAVTLIIFSGEVIGGILSNSLALLSDAGHVLTDAFALGLSLIASMVMRKVPDYRATYGYQRIGILAALINGVSLVVIAMFIFVEGYKRFKSPPEINSDVMLAIATAGLIGNLVMAWILGHKHDDLNIKSAWLHVIGDTISSAGVIAAGLIIKFTGWLIVDPIVSGFVGVIIIIGGVRVIKESLWIFLELSPAGFKADEIAKVLSKVPGIINIHDVHIWSIGHGIPAFSAHVQIHDQKISEADCIRKEIEHMLLHLGILHSVIQMECAECDKNGLYCTPKTIDAADHKHQH